MVADLAYVNGQAQMFSVLETPWHREGLLLQEAPTFDDAIALVDYPLSKMPYGEPDLTSTNEDGVPQIYKPSKNVYMVYRPDTGAKLGQVGKDYEIVTNRDAFEILRPLVDAGHLTLETGGVLRDGADAWLLGKWDLSKFGRNAQEIFNKENEQLLAYATVMANHNGRRGIMVGETSVRVVCSNTLAMAEREAEGQKMKRWRVIQHYRGAKVRLVEAAQELFHEVIRRFEVVAKQYHLLMECRLAEDEFNKLVLDVVAPDPTKKKKFNPEAKLANVVYERAMNKRREVRRLWVEGRGHSGEKNAWMAYNAVAEALDHNRELWPTRDGSWRTAALLTGNLADIKNKVLDGLVRHALSA